MVSMEPTYKAPQIDALLSEIIGGEEETDEYYF
jgi:hypothetical protein